jgi:hypothetical protein
VRVTAREEPDRIMLRSIKNTSRQVILLLAPTAAALTASESLHTINQKVTLQITNRISAVI